MCVTLGCVNNLCTRMPAWVLVRNCTVKMGCVNNLCTQMPAWVLVRCCTVKIECVNNLCTRMPAWVLVRCCTDVCVSAAVAASSMSAAVAASSAAVAAWLGRIADVGSFPSLLSSLVLFIISMCTRSRMRMIFSRRSGIWIALRALAAAVALLRIR